MKIYLTAAVALATLAACGEPGGGMDYFDRELGARVDAGEFGNATMNNTQVHSGASSVMINLQRRFAAEVNTTVTFAFNSARLDANAQATLRQQANWIKQFPEIRFKVFGHTDLVGSDGYNRSLGLRRAQAVVHYLSTQGISRSRLEAVVTLGETQPVVSTQQMERRNRRTVTEVSGFANGDGRELNGKYAEIIFRDYVESAVTDSQISQTATGSGGGEGGGN